MTENDLEFKRRKKSEKRLQAERQVIDAYSNCEKLYTKNDCTFEMEEIIGFEINGKFIKWRIKMKPEIEALYSTLDITKALNIPRERLRDWIVRDFVKPSLPSTRKGTIAIFTKNDVICVALFQKLIEMGFKREAAAEYIEMLIQADLIGKVNFIVLLYTTKDGEFEISIQMHLGDKFELNIDSPGSVKIGIGAPVDSQIWEAIHIINMANLEMQVTSLLEKID